MKHHSDLFPGASPGRLRRVFDRTEIRRAPLTGIVQGFHTLPYSLVGPDDARAAELMAGTGGAEGAESPRGSVLLTGKISVSPKLILPVTPDGESFGDAFPEEEPFMDPGLVGRVFAFAVGKGRNLRVRNEHLTVETLSRGTTIRCGAGMAARRSSWLRSTEMRMTNSISPKNCRRK
jgi:hypothetical protein